MTAADVKPGCGPQPASLTIAPLQGGTRKVYLTYPHSLITQGAFRVLTGDFVTEDAGCGVVHCAPAFGEEDYKVRARVRVRGRDRVRETAAPDSRRAAQAWWG